MSDERIDPWTCQLCGQLMYSYILENGVRQPVDQAPPANFISPELERVCTLCFEMDSLLRDRRYWTELVAEKAREIKRILSN